MAMFSFAAVGCTGVGAVAAGWVELNPHLGWRWIQWIHFMCVLLSHGAGASAHAARSVTAVFTVSVPFLMKETRSAVVLTRIAKKLRKKTGNHRYRARVEDERASLRTLIWISCTRPVCECCPRSAR